MIDTHVGAVPNRASDPLQDATSPYRPIPSCLYFPQEHLRDFGIMPQRLRYGHGQEEEVAQFARSKTDYDPTLWSC